MHTIPGYHIHGVLSKEKDAVVYRGLKKDDQRAVLLKVMKAEYPSPRELARLEYEYEITKTLDVEGRVRAYGLEKHHHGLVLLLEDPGGAFLAEVIAARRIDLPAFLRLGIRLAEIIRSLHQHHIIHQDIKPGNILVDLAAGDAWITGFGVATRLSQESQQIRHPDSLEGTLAYMSPEQTGRVNRAIDYRTDLYALGVTFYEMLTGALPFQSTDPMELIHAHVAQQPVPPSVAEPGVPQAVSDIVVKLLAKTAEERYQSAYGLRVDLESCLTQLQATGRIEAFVLGQQDLSDRFQIPQKLYGREAEWASLMSAFERVCQGMSEIVLVTGPAGVGKSSLVRQMHEMIVRRSGYFAAGKFDQLQHNIPYSAFIQACRDLIRQLLTEGEEDLRRWKAQLLEALSPSAQVVTQVVPELELIIGPQPAVPPLGPTEARNRFNLVWRKFINVFSRGPHPLVLFLDDLQWADAASLHLVQHLMTDPDSHHVLMIGACRDHEARAAHPLQMMLENLKAQGAAISQITLTSLHVADLTALLADTLHVEAGSARPLAELVFHKTNGNPFSVVEFLKVLYQKQLLAFDMHRGSWTWELAQVQEVGFTDNVIDLMTGKIQFLLPATRTVLQLAACIGNTFDLRTLAVVYEKPPAETAADLWEAIREGLVVPGADYALRTPALATAEASSAEITTYRFLHDRVQQAAYALIGEDDKKKMHLRIGRLLRNSLAEEDAAFEEWIFDLVNHLNIGADLLAAGTEKVDLARLNLLASRKAKAAAAYDVALAHARTGTALLAPDSWQAHYGTTFALHLERTECEYLVGHFEQAEAFCDLMLKKARSDQEKVQVYNLKITLYTSLSRYEEAVKVGVTAARLLGLRLPESPGQTHIIREFIKAQWHLRGKKVEDLMHLPAMMDPHQLTIINLLMNLTAPAFLSSEVFAILISLKMFTISLQHGLSRAAPYGYMVYAVVNAGMGRAAAAYTFGEMALRLSQRLDHAEKGHILPFLFATAINHWQRHARTNLDYLLRSYQASLEAGDLIYADYSLITIVVNSFFKGDPLEQVWKRCDQYLDFFEHSKGSAQVDTAQRQAEILQRQQILSLRGLTRAPTVLSDEHFDEEAFLAHPRVSLVLLEYYTSKLLLLYLFEAYTDLPAILRKSARVIDEVMVTGDVRVSEHFFYTALSLAALYPTAARKRACGKALRKNQRRLRKWATRCPENFLHKYLLVEAEIARLSGRDRRAMDLYDRAIAAARSHGFIQVEALANELAARFYLAQGSEAAARAYLLEARYGYAQWGAAAKVNALDAHYPHLLSQQTASVGASDLRATMTGSDAEALDLATVMKASQAISEEIVLDRLLGKMMQIVLENAGAQRGCLILEKNNQLFVEATCTAADEAVSLLQSVPVHASQDLSPAIVHYVARTRESVVLHDASREGLFTKDAYVARGQHRSILCTPLMKQGHLTGILYLENNLTTGAFTPDRLGMLRLLSAQIAISIENARLYKDLEQKVAERTEELRAKNVELEATLRHLKATQRQLIQAEKMASLGQLTAGIAHEIQNPLNFINNFADLSAELCAELTDERLATGGDRTPDEEAFQETAALLKMNLNKIGEHGKRADRIVKGMLAHARIGSGERMPADINTLLDEGVRLALHGFHARAPHFNPTLRADYDASIRSCTVVPQDLSRTFLNIVDNGCYSMYEKWKAQGEAYTPELRVSTKNLGDRVEIRIRDNGLGIPQAMQEQIFHPFFTTKPTGEGTGLGLSLSHEIVVDGHGGEIRVASAEGAFAEFIIGLPHAPLTQGDGPERT